MLDDAAAEEGHKNADLSEVLDEIPGTMSDEQLAEQFNAAVLAGHELDMGQEAPSKRSRGAMGSRSKRSTSMFNESTIWFGRTPLVMRTDTPAAW